MYIYSQVAAHYGVQTLTGIQMNQMKRSVSRYTTLIRLYIYMLYLYRSIYYIA